MFGLKICWKWAVYELAGYIYFVTKVHQFIHIKHLNQSFTINEEKKHPLLVIGSFMTKPHIVLRRRREKIYYLAWLDDDLTCYMGSGSLWFMYSNMWKSDHDSTILLGGPSLTSCVTRMFRSQSSNHNSNQADFYCWIRRHFLL